MTGREGPDLDQVFRDEATQRLDEMDAALLAAESGTESADTVDVLFRHAHTLKGTAGFVGRDDIANLAHAIEDVLDAVRAADGAAGQLGKEVATVLLQAVGMLRAQVSGEPAAASETAAELDRIRVSLAGPASEGEAIPPSPEVPVQGPAAADQPPATTTGVESRLLRVPAKKVDHLIDVVAEIMRHRQRLTWPAGAQDADDAGDDTAGGQAAARMLDELKDTAVGMRTLPLATISGALPRVVRDLAVQAGKDVEFTISGAGTELDRVVLESLSEPLAHLLRNAVRHGIEGPAERDLAGKPPRGRIELRAVPRGSTVEVAVADDGRGVSAEVAEAARRAGSLTDLLTRPGYSTAGEVTDVAGRGVGLDAVRDYVRSFGGSLEIRSAPGSGTEVVLLLPLALSLIEALLFERGGAVYGVPLAAVSEVVTVSSPLAIRGKPMLAVRSRPVPLADVAALLGAAAPPLPHRPPALVIGVSELTVAVACDALIGQREIAVKPLGPLLAGLAGYLGASVLGDGRIALLIEPHALLARLGDAGGPVPGSAGESSAPPSVLVVEDSFTARELQRSILETAGYHVLTARDGRDALAVLDQEPAIALVVTDLDMPNLGGLGLTRAIRASPARSSLPVVVVTAHGSDADVREGIEAGADAYMAKRSFDQQALLATVERLVGG